MTSRAATKLARLNERFQSFYGDLEQEKTHRRALESDRMHAIEGRLDALERELKSASEAEKKARAESAGRLERMLRETEATLSARATAVEERLSASVTALTTAIESVHEALSAEKEQRTMEVETMTTSLSRRVEDFGAALDDERLARLEREAEMIARVGQEVNELRTKVEAERNTRESAVGKLASVVEECDTRAPRAKATSTPSCSRSSGL